MERPVVLEDNERTLVGDEMASPVCHVCHWRPDMWTETPLQTLGQDSLQKHFKRNHESHDHRCKVCNQSSGNRVDDVKPPVHRNHTDVFDSLNPAETSSLNPESKDSQFEFVLNTTNQTPPKSGDLRVLPDTPAFQPRTRTTPGAFLEQSTKELSSQSAPAGSIFFYDRGNTQGSDDSGYSSGGNRDGMAKSTQGYIHSRPWQRGYYEGSFYAVPGGFFVGVDEAHTSRASSIETSFRDAQTDVAPRPTEIGWSPADRETERLAVRSPPRQGVSPPINEASNDGLSSRPTETSTPESDCSWLGECSEDEDLSLEESHPFMQFKNSAAATVLERFVSWKQYSSGQDVPCDGGSEANGDPNQDKRKATNSATGKRRWADRSEQSKGISDDSERSSTQTTDTSGKRRRTSDPQLTFACPYTKKDPMSYRDCYRYKLSRIRDVKQHLDRCHRNPPYCPRCRGTFRTEEERDEHIREITCAVRPPTTFGGITEAQKEQLRRKSASNTSVEAQWFVVFDILFPGHDPRPQSPYIDTELLQDITLYQDYLTSNGPRILSDILTQRGAITWNLPNEERDLAAFQQTVFEEGLRAVFDQWVARRGTSRGDSNISANLGVPSEPTPPPSDTSGEQAGTNLNQPSGVPPTAITSVIPERDPTSLLAASSFVQVATSNQNLFTESLEGIFDFEQGELNFNQQLPCGGPDEELLSLMLDPRARSSVSPVPG